ncbi:integron integrase [Candidatus Accumulibacter contiguus]|jgi:integron integrase|uniref:integron integrase n=1 Tax=Candidatus Accumulibacter contiguus TaxID=2954381 RepID=UPI002FC2D9D8
MDTFTKSSGNCVNAGGASRPPRRLLEQLSDRIRVKHYSIRTEQAYSEWVRRFILFHGKRHPREMGAKEVEAFLTHLAVAGRVSASTQNQAKSALLFLYQEVLETELPWLDEVESAKATKRLPVVLTPAEVQRLLAPIEGTVGLILRLLYGTGMRIMECLRLRVKDVDFARGEILVREGKGFKDRVTMLPEKLLAPLSEHLARVKTLHEADLADGFGEVYLPWALERKYPNAAREWAWQYVFVAAKTRMCSGAAGEVSGARSTPWSRLAYVGSRQRAAWPVRFRHAQVAALSSEGARTFFFFGCRDLPIPPMRIQ